MGSLDAPLRSISSKLIRKFGKTITLRHVESGKFDPATDTIPRTPIEKIVKGVFEDTHETGDGGLVVAVRKIHVAALDITGDVPLDKNWHLEIDGRSVQISRVDRVYSGDEVTIYEIVTTGAKDDTRAH